jgi:hypothetical protein
MSRPPRSSVIASFEARTILRPAVALAVAAVLLLGSGCGWWGNRKQEKARAAAPLLSLDRWEQGVLHCGRGKCSAWYKLNLSQATRVVFEAEAPADANLPDFGLSLHDVAVDELAVDRAAHRRPRRIDKKLDAGLYFLHVFALDESDIQLAYKLQVKKYRAPRRAKKRAAPKPPPLVPVSAEVLEVERNGGEPAAVLLGAGTQQGIAAGQRGELVDGEQVIGQLEVVDVYEDGCRAKIVGGLTAPISLDTGARIMKPAR